MPTLSEIQATAREAMGKNGRYVSAEIKQEMIRSGKGFYVLKAERVKDRFDNDGQDFVWDFEIQFVDVPDEAHTLSWGSNSYRDEIGKAIQEHLATGEAFGPIALGQEKIKTSAGMRPVYDFVEVGTAPPKPTIAAKVE